MKVCLVIDLRSPYKAIKRTLSVRLLAKREQESEKKHQQHFNWYHVWMVFYKSPIIASSNIFIYNLQCILVLKTFLNSVSILKNLTAALKSWKHYLLPIHQLQAWPHKLRLQAVLTALRAAPLPQSPLISQ